MGPGGCKTVGRSPEGFLGAIERKRGSKRKHSRVRDKNGLEERRLFMVPSVNERSVRWGLDSVYGPRVYEGCMRCTPFVPQDGSRLSAVFGLHSMA